jgi:hypothetical protein
LPDEAKLPERAVMKTKQARQPRRDVRKRDRRPNLSESDAPSMAANHDQMAMPPLIPVVWAGCVMLTVRKIGTRKYD